MPDRWIVTSQNFRRHKTQAKADAEAARLADKTGKVFQVLQLASGDEAARIAELVEALTKVKAAYDGPKWMDAIASIMRDVNAALVPLPRESVGAPCTRVAS